MRIGLIGFLVRVTLLVTAVNALSISDDFSKFDSSIWLSQCSGCVYSDGSLFMTGSDMQQRMTKAVRGIDYIRGQFVKDESCDDHYIVLSTASDFVWSWASSAGAIKFVWNCDAKYLYGQVSSLTIYCATYTTYNVQIDASTSYVTFTDDVCGTLAISDDLAASSSTLIYVYVGADNDLATSSAVWNSFYVGFDSYEDSSSDPTLMPVTSPIPSPTVVPVPEPTLVPIPSPTSIPAPLPTVVPIPAPTLVPIPVPTSIPVPAPTAVPIPSPTSVPIPSPTYFPTLLPTSGPTQAPTLVPIPSPTAVPIPTPTSLPTKPPTPAPSDKPIPMPSGSPSLYPSPIPTHAPSLNPTSRPTLPPSFRPTQRPSLSPTHAPFVTLSPTLSHLPTPYPTISFAPTLSPTYQPTTVPTSTPTTAPTLSPKIFVSATVVRVAEADNTGDGDGGGPAVNLWLANRPTGNVFVSITSKYGQVLLNATSKSDDDEGYGPFVDDKGDDNVGYVMVGPFTPDNWEIPKSFTVTAINDDLSEWTNSSSPSVQYDGQYGDDELSLVGVSNTDWRYDELAAPSITVLIEDDDVASVKVSYPYIATVGVDSASSMIGSDNVLELETTEGSEEASTIGLRYGVSLNTKPYASVVVDISHAFSSHRWLVANSSTAFRIIPQTMTFTTANWNKQQRVKVTIYDDDIAREHDSYNIELQHASSSTDPAYQSQQPRVNLTVWEDDVAGVFISSPKVILGCNYDGDVLFGESYNLALTSQPTHAVSVYLTVQDAMTDATATETHLSLREFKFRRSDWNVEQAVYVNATSTDLQKRSEIIYHYITSSDPVYGDRTVGVAAENAGLGPAVGVSVVVSRDSTPPPKIQSAYFTAAGGAAEITFDRLTNQGGFTGSFLCSRLLYGDAVDNFGTNALCRWSSTTLLRVTLPSDASVLPGEYFTVRNKRVASSAPNATLYTTNATAKILAKNTAVKPNVILTAPSVIGMCDSLLVDARLTTGSGGRSFLINWTVTFPNGLKDENASRLNVTTAVEEANNNGLLYVTIPVPNHVPISTMVFSLTVGNWLGNEDMASVTIKKADSDPPIAQIAGYGSSTSWRVAESLRLKASATMPACGGGGSTKLTFQWSEPSGYLSAAQLAALATSQPRSIQIGAGVMTAGRTYVFRVTTFIAGNANTNSSAELSVYGEASELFAAITGGSSRKQSRLDPLTLDATKSYDPDRIGFNGHLNYTWTCYDTSTHDSCTSSTSGDYLVLPNQAQLIIPERTLSSGDYVIRLWLSCPGDNRNSTASVDISLAATEIPVVSINALTRTKVNNNAGSYLQLNGRILGDVAKYGTVTYKWTRTQGDAPDADSGYTSVFASSVNRLNTVLELGALTQGSTYKFRLTAYAQGDDDTVAAVSGFAVVTVPVNSPPSSGTFSVSPSNGVALTTDFTFSCANWVDDAEDLPLKYGFRAAPGMEVATSSVTLSLEQMVYAATTSTSYVAQLPEGDNTGKVSCVAYIRDRFLGATRTTTTVSVSSLAASFFGRRRRLDEGPSDEFGEYMLNLSTALLEAGSLVGDSEGMVGTIANVASVTNSEDGGAALSNTATAELLGGLVSSLQSASSTIDASEESIDLLLGSMSTVASSDTSRMTANSQGSLLSLSLRMLGTANDGDRIAISEASGASACSALAALVASDDLFGPSVNASNNSVAFSAGLKHLASGTLVDKYAGMDATETSCKGLIVSAQKFEPADTDGASIATGNTSFTFPANFSKMTNMSVGSTIETSSQVLVSNPHRGASNASINTDTTSLSLFVSSSSGSSRSFPVSNLSAPISIRMPLNNLASFTVTCSGVDTHSESFSCPDQGRMVNHTCSLGDPYVETLSCGEDIEHQCVFWDTANKEYSNVGCLNVGVVVTGAHSGYIICNCTHLTDFTSQIKETSSLASDVVTSVTSVNVKDVLKNILVLVVLLLIYGTMIIACMYARYLDGKDRKKVVPFGVLPHDFDNQQVQNRCPETGQENPMMDMIKFISEGDGTDYGQHPDSLNPKAMTRRLHKSVLKLKAYQDQANAAVLKQRQSFAKLASQTSSFRQSSSISSSSFKVSSSSPISKKESGWSLKSSKVVHPTGHDPLPAIRHTSGSATRTMTDGGGLPSLKRPVPPPQISTPMFSKPILKRLPKFNYPMRLHSAPIDPLSSTSMTRNSPIDKNETSPTGAPAVEKEVDDIAAQMSYFQRRTKRASCVMSNQDIRSLLEEQKKGKSLRINLWLSWWDFIKRNHKIVSIAFGDDVIFTRPERIMVLAVFLLYTMAVNCFLYIFQGNANTGRNVGQIVLNQLTYVVLTSICLVPIILLVTLLFKRTAPARPCLEDRWIAAPRSEIPKNILKAVQKREELLLAERQMYEAKQAKTWTKRFLRDKLEEMMRKATIAGRSGLTEEEEEILIQLKEFLVKDYTEIIEAARSVLAQAKANYDLIQKEQDEWVKNRVNEQLEAWLHQRNSSSADNTSNTSNHQNATTFSSLSPMDRIHYFMVKHFVAKRKARADLAHTFLSLEEKAMLRAEEKQMEEFGTSCGGKMKILAYTILLDPLKDLKAAIQRSFYLPLWGVYAVHGFCVLLAGFCSYYIFLFSVMLNRCSKCSNGGDDDGLNENDCSTCPDSMKNNDSPNADVALDWLLSVLYAVIFNVMILEPLIAGMQAAVYPVVANWALKINWDKYLLSGTDEDILREVGGESGDEDEEKGGEGRENQEVVPLESAIDDVNKHSPAIEGAGEGAALSDAGEENKTAPVEESGAILTEKVASDEHANAEPSNRAWVCECGFSGFDSQRHAHLVDCSYFSDRWLTAFHALVEDIQQKIDHGQLEGPAPDSVLQQRMQTLEKAVKQHSSHHHRKGRVETDRPISEDNQTNFVIKNQWWDNGMLLASLVECGGDVHLAGTKLCQGWDPSGSKHKAKLAARLYRREMNFAADLFGLEALLGEISVRKAVNEHKSQEL